MYHDRTRWLSFPGGAHSEPREMVVSRRPSGAAGPVLGRAPASPSVPGGFNGGVAIPTERPSPARRSAEPADADLDRERTAAAVELAERLLTASISGATRAERRQAARLGRLLADPGGRALLFALTDEVLRTPGSDRSMRQLRALVGAGLPRSLPALDRLGMRAAALGSIVAAGPVAAIVRQRIRAETRGVIVPAAEPRFGRHVARRRAAGFTTNVNLLGEAILGDDEAATRLDALLARMRRPDVDYVSVKISALCANLDVLAFESEVGRIAEHLRTVYRVAAERRPGVFVNLDMEEHRDLDLTVEAFCRVLDETEFHDLAAGIVLQAYLPDTHAVVERLVDWSDVRHRAGRAPIKVRVVKGANLAMEDVDAELGGWEPTPYPTKAEVDASYKAVLDRLFDAAARGGLLVGVASHNLFDVAWALDRRRERGLDDRVGIEMLEGMVPPQSRVTRAAAGEVLLYTPVVTDADFAASIAYLSRRLDENAGPENFLRSLFTIEPGSPDWEREVDRFEQAVAARHGVSTSPRRTQDRTTEQRRFDPDDAFTNEPDTDFTSSANRRWIATHLADEQLPELPPLVATITGIDQLVERAGAARWSDTSTAERRRVLCRVAEVMTANRGRTLAVMARETGKTVREGDPEVSEAIDFARWAAASTREIDDLAGDGVSADPLGVVLVAGPWNFPTAIPANGAVAALAAGNAVLLKPAPEAVASAVELTRHLHEAGVPADAVQLVRCADDEVGRHLVAHPDVGGVVLTGAYETARMFLGWKPSLRLVAETSGKNSLVITQTADVDLALRDLVRSAFGHAGQKCSAASLAIVEAPLYDDPLFHQRLADAVRSLRVGPATELTTMVGPLVTAPGDKLRRGLTELDSGESWLVEPRPLDDDGRIWSPGVRVGVRPGSWFHRTECFGPVLGVIRADDLDHAIEIQNAVEYGLTGGIHALDRSEIERWLARAEVGNAYVNRHTTGAIVRRQPFGGWKRSSVGRGAKGGGPGDIFRFVTFRRTNDRPAPDATRASYRQWWHDQFGIEIDRSGLRAEANVFRYRPVDGVIARVGADASSAHLSALRTAAAVTGVALEISVPPGDGAATPPGEHDIAPADAGGMLSHVETDDELANRIGAGRAERLRLLTPCRDVLRVACHEHDVAIDETAVTHDGRVELPCWLREQAVSRTRHRHGRVDTSR